jgi:hypothetical protein
MPERRILMAEAQTTDEIHWESLRPRPGTPNTRVLVDRDTQTELSGKVMRTVQVESADKDSESDALTREFIILKLWIENEMGSNGWMCHHYVVRFQDGVIVAYGSGDRDKKSWEMARKMMVNQGIEV